MTQIKDSVTVDASGLTKTTDGYLVGVGKIARAGNVQMYLGKELGLTGDDAEKAFGVYRDPDVVFNKDAMLTLAGRPVTLNHPDAAVTSDNWKDLSIGAVGGTVAREGEHIVAPMVIQDAAAVKLAESGSIGLSAGYTVDYEPSEGVSADGTPYQFRQTGKIRFNHVALLHGQKPRAGNTVFGDSQTDGGIDRATRWGAIPLSTQDGGLAMADTTLVRDGMTVTVSDSSAQILSRIFADADKKYEDMKSEYETLKKDMATKQGQLDALEAEMKKAKDAKLSDADIDALADNRAALKADAKSVLGDSFDMTGKSSTEIKTAVLARTMGDSLQASLDAQPDDAARRLYVDAAFDAGKAIRVANQKNTPDAFRKSMMDGVVATNDAEALWDSVLKEGA